MTIISHSHRFIFIKARKVASSSLLVALGQYCSGQDIVTAPGDTEGYPNNARNDAGTVKTHTHPDVIRRMAGETAWESYTKVTAVRNPWDVAVSSLLWRYYRGGKRWNAHYTDQFRKAVDTRTIDPTDPEFKQHMFSVIESLPRNCNFYFADDGSARADVYLRYETLQPDYDALCQKLGLPQNTLPILKAQSRVPGWNYREFFDEELKTAVYDAAKRTIEYFDYSF